MNENKKLLVIMGCLVAVVILVIAFAIASLVKDKKLYEQFEEAYSSDGATLVYIGRPGCGYCRLLNPGLEDMAKRYNFDYIYFDIDDYSSSYFNKVLKKLNLSDIGTPYLAIVGNDGIINVQNGYSDYNKLFSFLQNNSIIDKDATLPIDYIDYSTYEKLINSDKPEVIVVGQSECIYCANAKVALNDIAEQYNIKISYLSIDDLTEEEYEKFTSSFTYFTEEKWGTPVMFIAKNKEMVGRYNGFSGLSDYISFLEEQGVI